MLFVVLVADLIAPGRLVACSATPVGYFPSVTSAKFGFARFSFYINCCVIGLVVLLLLYKYSVPLLYFRVGLITFYL